MVGCGTKTTDKTADNTTNPITNTADKAKNGVEKATNTKMKDGTYRIEQKDFDSRGWKSYGTITVKNNKITASEFDSLNADGKKKSEDTDYETNMKEKQGVGPKEYSKNLPKSLVDTQDASKVETVTGATNSSDLYKDFAKKLIDAAKKGDTKTITVDTPAE